MSKILNNLSVKISSTLKTLRASKGWSLDMASAKTGVSKAMLGQIERGESSPTIVTLWKIASGFDTSFSSFIEDKDLNTTTSLHKMGELKQIHPWDNKIRVMPLFPFDEQLFFEIFIIELSPGCEHLSPPHQAGVIEHVIVIDGEMEVMVGDMWHKLEQHDGLRFSADQPHGYRNLSSQKVVFHNIINYPGK